jgi:hypothetical protein
MDELFYRYRICPERYIKFPEETIQKFCTRISTIHRREFVYFGELIQFSKKQLEEYYKDYDSDIFAKISDVALKECAILFQEVEAGKISYMRFIPESSTVELHAV